MEKQEALDHYKQLIDLTLQYSIANLEVKQSDEITSYQKEITKHYTDSNLKLLKNWYYDLTEPMRENVDLEFISYLKEAAGQEINIYDRLENQIQEVIKRNEIGSADEYEDACILFDYLLETQPKGKTTGQLSTLIINFENLFDID